MTISKFVKAMVPSLTKNQVLEDIDTTIAEINETVIPAYSSAFEAGMFTDKYLPKSKWMKDKYKSFQSAGFNRRDSLFPMIHATMSGLVVRLEWIRKQLKTEPGTSIVADGITYKSATMLQLVSAAAWYVKYSRQFLLASYSYEIPEYYTKANSDVYDPPFSPVELKQINASFPNFMNMMVIFVKPRDDTFKAIESIPDFAVDEKLEESSTAFGVDYSRLNPMNIGFIPYQWNPVYHVKMFVADWQHDRYLGAKEEKVALELRLLALQRAKDSGVSDPNLEHTIAENTKRLMRLNKKIADVERSWS